jgi:hypothetical protein
MCKQFFVDQLKAFNGGMVIVAMCFSVLALYIQYTTLALWTLLVQYNIDHHPTYIGGQFASVTEYVNSLPDWLSVAYQLSSYLLMALLIWIIINLAHWIILIAYPLWISHQKEKYPLSY